MITFALRAYVPDPSTAEQDWDERMTKVTWQVVPAIGEMIDLGLVDYPDSREVKSVRHNLPLGENNPFVVVSIEVTAEEMKELQITHEWSFGYGCMMGVHEHMIQSEETF